MMYLKMIAFVLLFIAFLLVLMYIIENKIRNKRNEKILWKIDNMDKRDKVETRTGGLAHDRNRTYSEIQKQNDSKTQ